MAWLATVVAGFVVGTVSRNVTGPVTVVAEPGVKVGKAGARTVTCQMTRLVTVVADRLIAAFTGHVPWLLAVPAQSLCSALGGDVPWESTIVTDTYIWTFSGEVSRSLAILAHKVLPKSPALSSISSVWRISV